MIGAKAENPHLPARGLRSRTGICCVDDSERTSLYMRGWSLSGGSVLCWSSCQQPKITIIFNTHGIRLTVRDLERLSASSKCFVSAVLLSVVRGGKRLQAPSPDESMPTACKQPLPAQHHMMSSETLSTIFIPGATSADVTVRRIPSISLVAATCIPI